MSNAVALCLQIPWHVDHDDAPVASYVKDQLERGGALIVEQVSKL